MAVVEEQTEGEKQPQNSSHRGVETCCDLEHLISQGDSEGTGSLEPELTVWSFWNPTKCHQRSPSWHFCPVLIPCLGAVSCVSPAPSIPGTPAQ